MESSRNATPSITNSQSPRERFVQRAPRLILTLSGIPSHPYVESKKTLSAELHDVDRVFSFPRFFFFKPLPGSAFKEKKEEEGEEDKL